jgi:protein-S-isoprenylcysteine O-methyltransferase Ste14
MSPLLRTLLFTIVAPGFWTVLLPYFVLRRAARPAFVGTAMVWAVCGYALIAAGVVLYLACAFWAFALRGLGTPAPIDPPKRLIVEGPYRVVRNPMYWSVFFVMAGEAILFRSAALGLWAAGFFAGAMLFVVGYEEPGLRRKFGAPYEEYCRNVGRWLPHVRRG